MAVNDLRLVWLDMEMSGLDPEKERILEVLLSSLNRTSRW